MNPCVSFSQYTIIMYFVGIGLLVDGFPETHLSLHCL